MFSTPTLSRGSISLTATGLRLEIRGAVPFTRGVKISLQEVDGTTIKVFVRHDPDSKYNFGGRRAGCATVKIPRDKYYFIARNWGKTDFEGVWEVVNQANLLTFSLKIDALPSVARSNTSQRVSAGDKNLIIKARDCLNRYMEKGYVSVSLVDGKVVLDFPNIQT